MPPTYPTREDHRLPRSTQIEFYQLIELAGDVVKMFRRLDRLPAPLFFGHRCSSDDSPKNNQSVSTPGPRFSLSISSRGAVAGQ